MTDFARPTHAEIVGAYEATTGKLKLAGSEHHGPCPVCGGEDRFWINRDGGLGCRGCEPSESNPGAFKAIMSALGFGDPEAPDTYPAPLKFVDPPEPKPEKYGCTLEQFWELCGLEAREDAGITESSFWINEDVGRVVSVRIPFHDADGNEISVTHRVQVEGRDKYRYESGSKAAIYGLEWYEAAQAKKKLVIVEGQSCKLTVQSYGIPVYGLPGSTQAKLLTKENTDGIERIYVVQERDPAGEKFPKAIAARLKEVGVAAPVLVIHLDAKDSNDAFKLNPETAEQRFKRACLDARGLRTSRVKLHWATDIDKATFPPMRWVVPGLIPEGLAVIFSAPKTGKSFWAVQVAMAVAQGKQLFGHWQPEKGRVLCIDLEQVVGVQMQGRLRRHGVAADGYQTQVADDWPRIGDGCLEEMDIFLEENPDCRLVVVDVWTNIKPVIKRGLNAYDAEYDYVKQLRGLFLRRHACCIVVHHDRKGSDGGITEQASGSKALTGGANALLWLQRPVGETDGTLTVTGRDVEDAVLECQFRDRAWTVWPQEDSERF